ncbi:hypothetical protein AOQ84DRAFT_114143 [Glonium stellatum]|uniref:Uncharacterized protein n=1 Tax=Glonium stellatum TaxID=574774 RepID=A0A8E2F9Y6_9PEZI|nr:hypothetical protein AOQ84DRAFT_114143 [Glonium stellatum]
MIVFEKGSDRSSEVNVKEGNASAPADEFGQHIASDGAICCFVGIDLGEEIGITSNFRGSTTQLQYDILIDGVLRMSKVHSGMTGKILRKVDNFSQFYAKQDSTMFEAALKTKALRSDIELQKGGRETVGTIEVRISVLRRVGETYSLTDANQWYEVEDWYEQYGRKGVYTLVPPCYEMELEGDPCVGFSKSQKQTRIRKNKTPRPGTGPWATLRFLYRSKEAIARAELPLTYKHPSIRAIAHQLQLEPASDFAHSSSVMTESMSVSEGKSSCHSTPTPTHTNQTNRNSTKHCWTASASKMPLAGSPHDSATTLPWTPKRTIPGAGLRMQSEPAHDALTLPNEVRAASESPNGNYGHITHSSEPSHSLLESLATIQKSNFTSTIHDTNPPGTAKENVEVPTHVEQHNMRNTPETSINSEDFLSKLANGGGFTYSEPANVELSGNGIIQNGRDQSYSTPGITQNDAKTAKVHSGMSKKRPSITISPPSISKRAKPTTSRESDQLKKDIVETARRIEEAKARRSHTQALRDEAEARLVARRKKQLELMNAQLEEEMRLEREADEERLAKEESLDEYDHRDNDSEDNE